MKAFTSARDSPAKKIGVFLGIALCGIAVLVWGILEWRDAAMENRVKASLQESRDYLNRGEIDSAWKVFRMTKAPPPESGMSGDWFDLELDLAMATHQLHRLQNLYERNPERFIRTEAAVDWLQRLNVEVLGKLDESLPATPSRVLQQADLLIREGKKSEAIDLLESTTLEGRPEVNRLLRLANLQANRPERAWACLSSAYKLEPRNPEVRSLAGRMLEAAGNPGGALGEYTAARHWDPDNPLMHAQLADYHLRMGRPSQAMAVWEAWSSPGENPFARSLWFWNRVLGKKPKPTVQTSDALANLLSSQADGEFWPKEGDMWIEDARQPLDVFWLRVLQALKEGDETRARKILGTGIATTAGVAPVLKNRLENVLGVRAGTISKPVWLEDSGEHPLGLWLNTTEDPASAFAETWIVPVIFAVEGWNGAAADLVPAGLPPDLPDWAAYSLAYSALLADRKDVFESVCQLKPDVPAIQLLQAEALLASGKRDEALRELEALSIHPEIGPRVARIRALALLQDGRLPAARQALQADEKFRNSVAGREIEGRIRVAEGDDAAAAAVYEEIEKESDEARIFLARRAFAMGDFDRAEQLTRDLVESRPGEAVYTENLRKIQEARKARPSQVQQ